MKKFKKILLFTIICLLTLHSQSQVFKVKGGGNLNNVLYENAKGSLSDVYNLTIPGFHFGATMENSISQTLSVESGLMVSLKGYKADVLQDGLTVRNKTYLYYFDVPIVLKATFNLGKASKWYVAAGPIFDIGFAGNYITVYDWNGTKQAEKEKIEWGNEEGQTKRFDYGLTFGGGIEFNDWQVGVYYDLGLNNISPDASPDITIKNRVWKISVGYLIGSKN